MFPFVCCGIHFYNCKLPGIYKDERMTAPKTITFFAGK